MKYRRKPEIVYAIKYELGMEDDFYKNDPKRPFIHSEYGPLLIEPGDYIVTHENCIRSVCSEKELNAKYEKVED